MEPIVITGLGAITPLGLTVEEFWSNLCAGVSGVGPITQFDTTGFAVRIAAEVKGFDPEKFMDRKEARRMARFSQMAVAAASEAIANAGLKLEEEDRDRIGVVLGNGNGGYPEIDQGVRTILAKGGMRLEPLYLPKTLPNMAASQISMQFGLKGYNSTVTTACAAGTQAMGDAMELIRSGRAEVVVTGGTEAGISELGLAAFCVMRALSTRNDEPERASRPFDAERDGFVCCEGAAIFVFESMEHALARGVPVLAELVGYGASADAYHLVAPCADGNGAARAMRWALEDAGVSLEEVDYINAHGTSTPLNDASETVAIKQLFGEYAYRVPVSSTKSMIGHGLGASGALESVACVKTLQTGIIHPTINYEHPDPECDLDYVPNVARQADVRVILKNSFGFGGQNACLVFRRFEE